MARAVEHAGGHFRDRHALVLSERCDVLGRGRIKADNAVRVARADGDLVHIGVRRVQQAAARGDGQDGEGIGHRLGGQRRAFERIERNVDLRPVIGADFLADIEHRRFVALAFADDDAALEVDGIEGRAHRINCSSIRLFFVAAADFLGRRNGCELGHTDHRVSKSRRQNVVFHGFLSPVALFQL